MVLIGWLVIVCRARLTLGLPLVCPLADVPWAEDAHDWEPGVHQNGSELITGPVGREAFNIVKNAC